MTELDLSDANRSSRSLALYDGKCPACDEQIKADIDYIIKNDDDEWVHEDCLED